MTSIDGPLLTYIDDASDERVNLTSTALGTWAARTASLLRDGYQMAAGDRVAVLLPPHWQTAAVLLGAWSLGITVSYQPWATAGLPAAGPGATPLEAVFVSYQRLRSWLEEVPEAWHRFVLDFGEGGTSMPEVPTGYHDYVAEVSQYSEDIPEYASIRATDPASPDGTTYQQWAEIAHEIATGMNLGAGDKLFVDTSAHEQPVTWLLAPLVAGASIVLCANLDCANRAARVAAEGATHVL